MLPTFSPPLTNIKEIPIAVLMEFHRALLFKRMRYCLDAPLVIIFTQLLLVARGAGTWGGAEWQPPTLEKIRVGHAHPGNTNCGLKTFKQLSIKV